MIARYMRENRLPRSITIKSSGFTTDMSLQLCVRSQFVSGGNDYRSTHIDIDCFIRKGIQMHKNHELLFTSVTARNKEKKLASWSNERTSV